MRIIYVILFMCHIATRVGSSESIRSTAKNRQTYRQCLEKGTIHLTFDDGPVPEITNPLLDLLKLHEISVTFFVQGVGWAGLHLEGPQATLRRAVREGHRIESHTWNHPSLIGESRENITAELRTLADKLDEVIECRPTVMRPPYGEYTTTEEEIIHDLDYDLMMWNLDSVDWRNNLTNSVAYYEKTLMHTDPASTPGWVAIQHDSSRITLELTERFIDIAKTSGYRFVTLEECRGIPKQVCNGGFGGYNSGNSVTNSFIVICVALLISFSLGQNK